ncbi:hypothetical protein B566_EDAN012553 [Ephemera danica]|nr:hypothetical protein B566_EDAN012553 [Ephemera danica]
MATPAVRALTPELQKISNRDLFEEPERLAKDIEAMREWLKKQPHILDKPDDQMLTAFLRGCKFSLERTKKKLDMYYTVRTALPEFFKNRDLHSKKIREILELGTFVPLPELDDEGRRVLIGRFGMSDPATYKIEEMFKLNCMMMDYMIREDDPAIVCGSVSVMDMSGMSMGHVTQMSPTEWIKKIDEYADWFLSPAGSLGVDESKRPGKPKTHQDLFGLEGSFRQLNVD